MESRYRAGADAEGTSPRVLQRAPAGLPPGDLTGVFGPGRQFSRSELQAMALDGIVHHVYADAYIRAGEALTSRLRAAAIGLSVPANIANRAIVGRLSAAWIYGCAAAPERVALLVDAGHRVGSLRPWSGCHLHEVQLGRFDAVALPGCRVTTPLRTAVDLALYEPHEAGTAALQALCRQKDLECPPSLVRAALLAYHRVPHKAAALARIARLEAC